MGRQLNHIATGEPEVFVLAQAKLPENAVGLITRADAFPMLAHMFLAVSIQHSQSHTGRPHGECARERCLRLPSVPQA